LLVEIPVEIFEHRCASFEGLFADRIFFTGYSDFKDIVLHGQ